MVMNLMHSDKDHVIQKVVLYKGKTHKIIHTICVENLHGYLTVRDVDGTEEGHLEYYWVEDYAIVMIEKLYVAPKYRHQGVATDLICFLLTLVRDYQVHVHPSAGPGISQRDLENFYRAFSFGLESKSRIRF